MKTLSTFSLLIVLLFIRFNGTTAINYSTYKLSEHDIECLNSKQPSACFRKVRGLIPTLRVGRSASSESGHKESPKRWKIVAAYYPRIGRSDPSLAGFNNHRIYQDDDDEHRIFDMIASNQAVRGKEDGLKNLENYFPAQRRNSNGPWSYFLITPNSQSGEYQQLGDNLFDQIGNEIDNNIKEE